MEEAEGYVGSGEGPPRRARRLTGEAAMGRGACTRAECEGTTMGGKDRAERAFACNHERVRARGEGIGQRRWCELWRGGGGCMGRAHRSWLIRQMSPSSVLGPRPLRGYRVPKPSTAKTQAQRQPSAWAAVG